MSISFTTLLSLTSWADSLLYCKEYANLDPNHKDDQKLNGSFRITTFYKNSESWLSCHKNIALPELISHHLHLNLSFIKPNNDFDETWGWYNGTHSSGPMKMLVNDQVDYIINNIYINESLWHPNTIAMTTALDDNYKINFLTKKYKIIKKFGNYNLTFDWTIWLMFVSLILLISGILCLEQMTKKIDGQMKFPWKLFTNFIIDNWGILFSKHPSYILSKLTSRQLIMVAIPMLSILTINLINSSHYSHTIEPVKEWCESLDCFINHKPEYRFYQFEDGFTRNLMKNSKEFGVIMNRTKIHTKRGKIKLNNNSIEI